MTTMLTESSHPRLPRPDAYSHHVNRRRQLCLAWILAHRPARKHCVPLWLVPLTATPQAILAGWGNANQ